MCSPHLLQQIAEKKCQGIAAAMSACICAMSECLPVNTCAGVPTLQQVLGLDHVLLYKAADTVCSSSHVFYCSNWILEQQWRGVHQCWCACLCFSGWSMPPICPLGQWWWPLSRTEAKEAKEEGGSIHGGMQTAAKSNTLRVMETRPKPS